MEAKNGAVCIRGNPLQRLFYILCLSVCFVGREVNHVCVAFRKKNWKSLGITLPLLGLGKKGDLLTYLETFAHTRGVMGILNILLMSYERGGKIWLCLEGIHNIDRYTLTHSLTLTLALALTRSHTHTHRCRVWIFKLVVYKILLHSTFTCFELMAMHISHFNLPI